MAGGKVSPGVGVSTITGTEKVFGWMPGGGRSGGLPSSPVPEVVPVQARELALHAQAVVSGVVLGRRVQAGGGVAAVVLLRHVAAVQRWWATIALVGVEPLATINCFSEGVSCCFEAAGHL